MPYALGTTYKTYRSGFTSRRRHIDDWISRHFYKFASWLISWSFPRDWRVRVNSRKSTSFIFLGWHAIVITTNTILTVTIITTTNTISQSRCLEWLPRKHRNLLLGICLNCAKLKNENLELLEKVRELEGKLQQQEMAGSSSCKWPFNGSCSGYILHRRSYITHWLPAY